MKIWYRTHLIRGLNCLETLKGARKSLLKRSEEKVILIVDC